MNFSWFGWCPIYLYRLPLSTLIKKILLTMPVRNSSVWEFMYSPPTVNISAKNSCGLSAVKASCLRVPWCAGNWTDYSLPHILPKVSDMPVIILGFYFKPVFLQTVLLFEGLLPSAFFILFKPLFWVFLTRVTSKSPICCLDTQDTTSQLYLFISSYFASLSLSLDLVFGKGKNKSY